MNREHHRTGRLRALSPHRLVVALAALATLATSPAYADPIANALAKQGPGGPSAVFPTIEAAALDAIAWTDRASGPRDEGRIRVGTIHAVAGGGYAYQPPHRSRDTIWSRRAPVLRVPLRGDDVASYVIQPRSGDHRLDRMNESPSRALRRFVEEVDPQRRPVFLLTPSRRVIRYASPERSVVAERPRGTAVSLADTAGDLLVANRH